MKTNLKRKENPLGSGDSGHEDRDRTIDAALNLVVFRKDILKSLEKVAGKGGVEKVLCGKTPDRHRSIH
jgi:hypothetical protein